MDWNQLLECGRGRGSYLLCQLPLVEKYDVPADHAGTAESSPTRPSGAQFLTPAKSLKLVADPAALTTAKLKDMEVAFQPTAADAKLDRESVVLVDAAALPADFSAPAGWKKAMEQSP